MPTEFTEMVWPLQRFRLEWENGSRVKAIEFAREYIAENKDEIMQHLGGKTMEELVSMTDAYRSAGELADVTIIDMWIHAGYVGKRVVDGTALLPKNPASEIFGDSLDIAYEFERLWHSGQRDIAREFARHFVDTNRDTMRKLYGDYTLEDLVVVVDTYRINNDRLNRIVTEIWITSEYEPQKISGQFAGMVEQFLQAKRS